MAAFTYLAGRTRNQVRETVFQVMVGLASVPNASTLLGEAGACELIVPCLEASNTLLEAHRATRFLARGNPDNQRRLQEAGAIKQLESPKATSSSDTKASAAWTLLCLGVLPAPTPVSPPFRRKITDFTTDLKMGLCLNDDGSRVFFSGEVCDRQTGQVLHGRQGDLREVTASITTPDCRLIITAESYVMLRFWDAQTGAHLQTLETSHYMTIVALDVTRDGKTLASSDRQGIVKLWATKTGALLGSVEGSASYTPDLRTCVRFSTKGDRLAAGGYDSFARIWKTATFPESPPFKVGGGKGAGLLSRVHWSRDDRLLFTSESKGDDIKVWDAASGVLFRLMSGQHGPTALILGLAGDETRLVVYGSSVTNSRSPYLGVEVRSIETGERLRRLCCDPTDMPLQAAMSWDGTRIVYTGTRPGWRKGAAWEWDLERGQLVTLMKQQHHGEIGPLRLSKDGGRLFVGVNGLFGWVQRNACVCVWSLETQQLVSLIEPPGALRDFDIDETGSMMVMAPVRPSSCGTSTRGP